MTAVADRPSRGRRPDRRARQPGPGARLAALDLRDPRLVLARPALVAGRGDRLDDGDQAMPRLPTGGLVRWLGTRGELHQLIGSMGYSPPLPVRVERAQPRPVAVRPRRRRPPGRGRGPPPGRRRLARPAAPRRGRRVLGRRAPGQLAPLLAKLLDGLHEDHLAAVPVGRLMRDAGRRSELAAAPPTIDSTTSAARRATGRVAHRTPVVTSRTLDALVGARVSTQGRGVPARRRVQVPRRLQRGLLAAGGRAGARRLHRLVGQPRPGGGARGGAVRDAGGDPDARRRAGAQARRDRGLRRRGDHVRPLRRRSRAAGPRTGRRSAG